MMHHRQLQRKIILRFFESYVINDLRGIVAWKSEPIRVLEVRAALNMVACHRQ